MPTSLDDISSASPDVDGSSHFAIFTADSSDFGPPGTPLAGSYEYQVTMLDQQGQGWTILARFTIAP
ncbi:MAG: hypothetical protein WCI67_16510 [Chloroflexales bacterium]